MFKHKRSQNGFGIVELLCFIVMFSMVGLIGWYVINENMRSQETLDNIGGAEVQTSSVKPSAKAGDKFVFKELGVSIILPAELEGLSYKTEPGVDYLYLTTTKFDEAVKNCGYKSTSGTSPSFAAIGKKSGQYPSEPTNDAGNLLKQFDDFYISIGVPNGTWCEDGKDDEKVRSVAGDLQTAVGRAFEKAELVE